jgi:hypothetical protein
MYNKNILSEQFMSNNLYEQAIADARKIREVAEENAKKAVLEAVTPKIKNFIEQQILEKDEKEVSEEEEKEKLQSEKEEKDKDDEVELDETAVNALLDLIGEDNVPQRSREVMSMALNEAMNRLSSYERSKLFNMTQKINESVDKMESRSLYNNRKENTIMSGNEKYYEIDLGLLREALDENMNNETLYEQEEDDMEMPDLDDPVMDDEAAEGMEAGGGAADMVSKDDIEAQIEELIADLGLEIGGGDDLDLEEPAEDMDMDMDMEEEEGEEPEPLEEVFEVDPRMLRNELKRIRSRVNEAKGHGLAHQPGGIPKDYEAHFGGQGQANSKGGDFGGGKPGKDVLAEIKHALRNQRRQNGALQNKLTKYRSAVQTLREQLEELNLFNAKLLYVNKLLQNKTISESQKRSIVQALDEAKDLREAKVLYKSLTESFGSSRASRSTKTLNESKIIGGSSRATRSGGSVQASGELDRWAKLAGLK